MAEAFNILATSEQCWAVWWGGWMGGQGEAVPCAARRHVGCLHLDLHPKLLPLLHLASRSPSPVPYTQARPGRATVCAWTCA